MRKPYHKPVLRTETLQVGVYGSYGGDSDSSSHSYFGIFCPLFGFCCGG